ncbi:MAG: GerMN domain-containing protein [Candidatus Margulisiibacteriota bacterium]
MKKSARPVNWALAILIIAGVIAGAYYLFSSQIPASNIYFLKGEKLVAVKRALPQDADPLQVAALELMSGPNEPEAKEGIFSEIPKKAKITKVEKQGETANVIFNDEIENYGGGSARVQGLVAQIVYTFTDIPGIKRVKIFVGNRASVVLGGEGFVIDKPLSRQDLETR